MTCVHNAHTFATLISFLILSKTIIGTGCPGKSAPAGAWTQGIFVSTSPVLSCYRGIGSAGSRMVPSRWTTGTEDWGSIQLIHLDCNYSLICFVAYVLGCIEETSACIGWKGINHYHCAITFSFISFTHTHAQTVNTEHVCFVYELFTSNMTYECCICDNTCHYQRDWIISVSYIWARNISS